MTKARSNATAEAAKGDLRVGNGTNLSGILAVGNNGETIVADSSTSTGLRWTATPSASNPVLNSSFDIWQRGTSISALSSSNTWTADRWALSTFANCASTVSRQLTNDTTNLPNIQYCARFQRNSGQTGTNGFYVTQAFESTNAIPYAGKTVTMSFYARAGANYSPTSNALKAYLLTGTGTDQPRAGASYTGEASPINSTATLTTTWQRFSYVGTIATNVTEFSPTFEASHTGTAGANDYFEITGVQIDVGNTALPYRRNSGTFQGELAACQRYYYPVATGNGRMIGSAFAYSATQVGVVANVPVQMRTDPTLISTSGTDYYRFYRNGGDDLFNSLILGTAGNTIFELYQNTNISSTAGQAGMVLTNNASASIAFSAEL